MAADGVFLILLKHGVELEIVDLPLAREADYQPALIGALDLIGREQVAQQQPVILLRYLLEGTE